MTTEDYRRNVTRLLGMVKGRSSSGPRFLRILDPSTGRMLGRLRHIPDCPRGEISTDMKLLAEWREAAADWFPSRFNVTEEGTRRWYSHLVFGRDDRILFMVETLDGRPVGHLGLSSFDFERKTCEIDNVVREPNSDVVWPGAMTLATWALARWAYDFCDIKKLLLRVFSDNERALALYARCGFRETGRLPLRKVVEEETTNWVEAPEMPLEDAERCFVSMCLPKAVLDRVYPRQTALPERLLVSA